MEEHYLSLSEAAGALGISERTAHRWIKSGKLRSYKPGRDHKIPESAIIEAIEAGEVRPKAQAPPSPAQPDFNGELDEERRIQALEHLPAIFRRCAEEWRKGLQHLEQQEPYWFWVVQAAANDFTDMLYRSDLLHKVRELPPEDFTPQFFEDLTEGGQKRGTADPELVAAVDLVDAFIEMHDAAEAVFEAIDAWEDAWLVNSQAEQRREQVREMTQRIA
jgi:excisionase family DNA binding protein